MVMLDAIIACLGLCMYVQGVQGIYSFLVTHWWMLCVWPAMLSAWQGLCSFSCVSVCICGWVGGHG